LRTTKTIIRCIGNEDEFLISSSAVLFSAIAVRCVSSIDTFPEIIDAWVPALENELGDVTDPCQEESIMLVKMLRPSMNVFLQALESSSAKGLQLALKNIVKAARPMTEYCIQAIHSHLSSNQDEIYLHVLADCMYFMADAIFIEHTLCEEHVESTITARGPIGEVLRTVMERLSNPEVCNNTGLLYLFGTFIGRDYLVGRSTVEMMLRVHGIFVEQCKPRISAFIPLSVPRMQNYCMKQRRRNLQLWRMVFCNLLKTVMVSIAYLLLRQSSIVFM